MPSKRFPVKRTWKGTNPLTYEELRKAGYSAAQARKLAAMDVDNELPRQRPARRGRPPKGENKK
jgi:ribosomal protein L13E